jgi:hypothetical protein
MKLSDAELNLLCDAERFRVQQRTGVKISDLFGQLKLTLTPLVEREAHWLPQGCLASGKLSKGDRHHGFPWMALDYPAVFAPEGIFAFRAVVIWGHHFSFHLILTGKWREQFAPGLIDNAAKLEAAGLRKCLGATPWDWTQDELGLLSAPGAKDDEFLKLSQRLPLDRFAEVPAQGAALYALLADVLRP